MSSVGRVAPGRELVFRDASPSPVSQSVIRCVQLVEAFKMTAPATGREAGVGAWGRWGGGCHRPEGCWQGEGGKSFGPEYVLVPVEVADGDGGRTEGPDLKRLWKGEGVYRGGRFVGEN